MIKQILRHYVHTNWLQAPPIELTESKLAVFDSIFDTAVKGLGDNIVDYDCEYPKHEFLSYLTEHKNVLLHGSNSMGIDMLKPMRKSVDNRQCGNIKGIYACSDGIHPIYFAILNRGHDKYLITENGCNWIKADAAPPKKFYHFSIETECAEDELWKEGMIYIVPRDGFEQLRDPAGSLLVEWVSREIVRPLAKLTISPSDFPFLRDVKVSHQGRPQTPPEALAPDTEVFDTYIGKYEVDEDFVITVVREQKSLFIQPSGYPAIEVCPESSIFSLGKVQIAFLKGEQDEVTELVISALGHDTHARKIA